MTTREERLKASFDFISRNFNATFDKVPKELRESWYCELNSDDEDQRGFAWSVFMYALLFKKKSEGVESFSMDEDRLSELFTNWQVCLSAAEINEVTDIKIKPFKIFDIENLEKEKIEISYGSPGI